MKHRNWIALLAALALTASLLAGCGGPKDPRSEEHTSELQSQR